jgi:hypothetical protein
MAVIFACGTHEPLPDQTTTASTKSDDDDSSESDDDTELPKLQYSRVLRRIIIEDFYKSGFTVARMLKSVFCLVLSVLSLKKLIK